MLTHQDERFPCLDATAAEFTRRDINANCITAKLIGCPAYRPLNLYHVQVFGSAFENMAQKQVFDSSELRTRASHICQYRCRSRQAGVFCPRWILTKASFAAARRASKAWAGTASRMVAS
jgi:hypothetical protein